MLLRARLLRSCAAGLLLGATGALPAAARSITGVCPDGSVFVVQRAESIPCAAAKLVSPEDVPPIRPENLPRPYTWQVYNEDKNPNNAYHLVDQARQVRELRDAAERARAENPSTPPQVGSPPPGLAGAGESGRAAAGPVDLGLSDGELHDLFLIVELSQERAPASFVKSTASGSDVLQVSLSHSDAFETRFHRSWGVRAGLGNSRVLLFSAVSRQADSFYANFTFVQGHLAFHPNADTVQQFGVLQGRLGPMDADEVVLGYVVLPETMRLDQPIDVYWNDRTLSVTFHP